MMPSTSSSVTSITPGTATDSVEQQQSNKEPPHKKRKLGSWLKASKEHTNVTNPVATSSEAMVKNEIEQY